MTITTQTADGVLHQFPDGTPDAVIDQAMTSYAAQPAPPQNAAPQSSAADSINARLAAFVPFNLGDEFQGAASTLADKIAGEKGSWGDIYTRDLAQARAAAKQYGVTHPVLQFVSGIPANVGAAIATGQPESLLGTIAQGAALGAASGFGAGEGGFENRVKSAVPSAALGAATAGVLGGAGRALQNPNVSPNVQLLQNEGIPLTPGQIMGGVAKKTEDIATSIPVMGDAIAARQSDSLNGLNRAVANRALAPIGQVLPDSVAPGRDIVGYVRQAMKAAYDKVLSGMYADLRSPSDPFFADINTAAANAAQKLPDEQLNQFGKILNSELVGKIQQNRGVLDGDTIKGIESTLTDNIKGYGKGGWNDQQLASALTDVKGIFRNMLARQNPNQIADLANVDRGYANYAILRQAGATAGNDLGVFSPAQLASAVRNSDASAGRSNYASGTALMQDLSDAAKSVLPSKYPDSGTARRLATASIFAPSAYATGTAIPAAAGIAAGTAAYSQPGNALLRSVLTAQRPGGVSAAGGLIANGTLPASILAALALQRATQN